MSHTRTHKRLWDCCCTYVAEKRKLTASDLYILHGCTLHEMVTSDTSDISEYADYEWYQPLWDYDDIGFPGKWRNIVRWLGVAHRVGQALCYWILTSRGHVIARMIV